MTIHVFDYGPFHFRRSTCMFDVLPTLSVFWFYDRWGINVSFAMFSLEIS